MLGQNAQSATEPQEPTSLEDRAFEQRTRGSYTFRFARQFWYGLSMAIMKNRRIEKPVSIEGADEAVKTVHASLSTDRDGLPNARDWVHEAQSAGYGVVVIPMNDGTETIVKTKRAEVAEQLTSDDASFVLNEPSGDWDDVSLASLLVVPALALAGLVGIVFVVGALR
jgi:hypothetical protein